MDISSIAARTQIVTLNTGTFRPTRKHRAETEAENARHNTNAARVLVRISDHPALKELTTVHQAAYQAHRAMTLPTVQDGVRLLPAGRQFEHAAAMAEFQREHDRLSAWFIRDYDSERQSAPVRLNGLYDPDMWPDHVESRFSFSTRYLPCPTDGAWGEWLSESARAAENEVRDRVTKALQRVVDRCRSDGPLYESVFTDLRGLLDMLPDLNLTQAPDLQSVVSLASNLANTHVGDARQNDQVRKNAAEEAARILSVLS